MQGKSVNFRGTSGSGKTTIMRHFLEEGNCERFVAMEHYNPKPTRSGRPRKPKDIIAYEGELHGRRLIVLGNYEPVNGGCDTIPSVHLISELLTKYMEEGCLVLFESLLISHGSKIIADAHTEIGKEHNVIAFIDTPLVVCLERVRKRRLDAGNTKPFNPANTTKDHNSVWNCRNRLTLQGYRVHDISYLDPVSDASRIVTGVCYEE